MTVSNDLDTRDLLKKAYLEIRTLRSRIAESEDAHNEPIAIVGLGCRFPAGAVDAESFWNVLHDGVDAVGLVPRERWDTDALFDPDPDAPGKLYTRHGAFVDGVDQFDAALFGISPVEASAMDPQQRLLLEVAWEALENAGIAADALRATRTGVFVGLMYQDYLSRQLRETGNDGIGPYLGVGSTFSAAAGRLSYVLGLQGPSIAIDTACSSSLVSVHLACQALRNRECDVALAGGANVMLTPEASINLSKARMLSPSGRCRTFDAAADGYIRGEGCGLIVLKRLSDARADGDRILGLVRGSAVNQDGRSSGLTAPNGSAQRVLLREALAAARATADDVEYIECHGTGTPLGDPIEVGALLDVYGERSPEKPLAIGSVKTNFGHLESAAGICGLIKSLLILRHREIPPHLHLTKLNPHIRIDAKPVVIPTVPTPWFRGEKRLAAISAFGFVGTNAHVILEAFDEAPAAATQRDAHVLTLSAASEPALHALRDRFVAHLQTTTDDLGDICFTANTGRSHLAYRIAVIAGDREEMAAKLREAQVHRIPDDTPELAPADTQTLDELVALHLRGVRVDWSAFPGRKVTLPAYAFQRERYWIKPAQKPFLTRLPQAAHEPETFAWIIDTTRAFLFEHRLLGTEVWPIAAQIAVALEAARELFGVDDCEIRDLEFRETLYASAAHVQVMLRAPDRAKRVAKLSERERSERRLEAGAPKGSAPRAREETYPALSMMFFAAKEEDDDRYRLIVEAARFADRNGFRGVWVPERHFTHMGSLYPSPSVLHAALARETKRVRLMAGSVVVPLQHVARIAEEWAMVDNLSGGRVGISLASGWNPNDFVLAPDKYDDRYRELYDGIDLLRRLWRGESFEGHAPNGRTVTLRTYPTPVQRELPLWVTAARSPESFQRAGALGANLLTHLLDQDVETLAGKIALYRAARAEHGFDPDAGIVSVMCHTFVAPDLETAHRLAKQPFCEYLKASMPLLAGLATSRGKDIDVHKLSGAELDEFVEFLYERFSTTRALIGTPETCRTLIDALHVAGVNEIACLLDFGPSTDEVLEHLPLLATLRQQTRFVATDNRQPATDHFDPVDVNTFYDSLSAAGIDFDGSLRALTSLAVGNREALAEVPASREESIVLDACIQSALAALPRESGAPIRVPTGVRGIRVHRRPAGKLVAHGRVDAPHADGSIEGDVTAFDEHGEVVIEIEGLHVRSLATPARVAKPTHVEDHWFYEIAWRELPWRDTKEASRPWIILEDTAGVGRAFASRRFGAPHVFVQPGAITEQIGPAQWTVDPERGFPRLLRHLDLGAYEGILSLWPLHTSPHIEEDQRLGIEAMTKLVQAFAQLEDETHATPAVVPPLWLVTRNAQATRNEPVQVSQSTLWGFAGALAREHPEWWGGIIDLDATSGATALDRALRCDDGEDQLAIRDDRRFARRLVRATAPAHAAAFRDDAAYLIAGGAGGLGLEVARWMIERGARHLILAGRSKSIALPALDASVTYVALDIADETQIDAFLASYDGPPLRGVIHAAGVFRDESLLHLDRNGLWDVLRSKVSGAWALHRATRASDLDFFVMFSSFSAITPPHGQAAYAAASAFLDALAHARRAEGLAALSINWGAWSEVGFAATEYGAEAHKRLEAIGMKRMTPREGLAALERLFAPDVPPQMAVFPMDVRGMTALDPAIEHAPLMRELARITPLREESHEASLDALRAMDAPTQRAFLEEQVARIVSSIMEIPASRLEIRTPLTQLGLDSLVAVQLKNRVQKDVGLNVPLVNALRGGSVVSLVDDLLVDLRLGSMRGDVVEVGAQQELEL